MKTIWYAKTGSDKDCIKSAIIIARATGSVGATEEYRDEKGNILKTATVMREGHQEKDFYKL